MAIYSIEDLRAAVPTRMKSLSDEELIFDYSKRLGRPYEDLATSLGVRPRGTLSQIGTGLVKGVDVGLRGMAGKAMEYGAERLIPGMEEVSAAATAGLPERRPPVQVPGQFQEAVVETGRGLQQRAKEREKSYLPADLRNKNYFQQGMIEGAESVAPTVATIGTSIVNPAAGAALSYGLFGYSSAKDTYDKLISEGVSEADARAAARKVELLQGGGEAALSALGAKVFKPFGRAFGAGAATTTGEVAQQLADTSILKPFAKAYLASLIAEPTTEVIQDVGTAMIEQAYGGKKQDLGDIASQSARGAIGMTLLLGPFALGAHVSRSRSAQEIKAALADDPNIAPERRATILQGVAAEAKRANIAPKDISSWVDSQVALADRQNTALELMEDAAKNNYEKQFEAAYTAPSGIKSTEVGPDGKPVVRELSMGDYLLQQAEAANADAEKNLLAREARSPAQVLADIRAAANDPLSPSIWRFPVSTGVEGDRRGLFAGGPEALTAPRPTLDLLGGGRLAALETGASLGEGQLAAARGPIDETAPRPAMGLGGPQQMAAGGPAALTSAALPVSQVGQTDIERLRAIAAQPAAPGPSAAQPANLPGLFRAQPAENIPSAALPAESRTAPFTAPPGGVSTTLPSAAPVAPGAFSTAPAAPIQAAAKPVKPVKAAKAVKPVVAKVAKAPKAPVLKKTVMARSIEQALDEEMEIADKTLDDARAKKIMADVNSEDLGAEVQGAKQIKAPGRVSLSQRSLLGIRDAIFRKSGKVAKAFGRKEQKVVDAVSTFTNAYDAYLDYSTNMFREIEAKRTTADESTAGLEDLAKDVQNSLYGLGQSLDNNAKNVEAVVRVVKDTVQQKLAKPGKTKKETLKALKTLDTVLSSGWAAAKRESFMKELPDLAEVSGQVARPSTEMQEKAGGKLISSLEDAAKNGYGNPQNTAAKIDGLKGVLQYLRFNTTPMGKVLARSIRDALEQSENPAKISFVDKGKTRYEPKNNTVYINRGEQSAEVVLHEAFHAALQWYVYQNPNAPAVKQLQLSLKRALDAKGLEGKALEVQNILQKLVNKERGLDAVLELVSYNATLNEFRRAMQEIKTGDAPKSFLDSIKSVWAMYKALVRRMLGVGDNVASDVLSASMELLEQSTKATMPETLTGKTLEAAVQSNKATQTASGITAQDYKKYSKDVGQSMLSFKMAFDLVEWNNKIVPKVEKSFEKLGNFVRKELPAVERWAIYIDSNFSAGKATEEFFANYKFDKSVGYQQMEILANFVVNRPGEQVMALFNYMDGNKKAIENLPAGDQAKMRKLSDDVLRWFDAYVNELPVNERAFFTDRKFSEALLFAGKSEQVATSRFGTRGIKNILGMSHRYENSIEGFKDWLTKDDKGDVVLDGRFYQVFKKEGLRPGGDPEIAGYMSKEEFDRMGGKEPVGYSVDTTREWWFSGFTKGDNYKFSTSLTASQAVQEKKADQLANAMRNTMAALANNYASKNLAKGIANVGYEDGKPTALTVAFDSLADIKKATGQAVNETQVLLASEDAARSPDIKSEYRRSSTWIKLPDTNNYGELRGKYIHGPVWTAMLDMSDRTPLVQSRAYNAAMRWFKKSKTVFNPSTHVTNVASNVTLAIMHDVPMKTLGDAAKIFALYEVAPGKLSAQEMELMSAFMNSGAMLGDYSSAEVKQALYEAWKANMSVGNDATLLKRLAGFTNYEKIKSQKLIQIGGKIAAKTNKIASETYAAEDNIFRLAAFLTKAGDLQRIDNTETATQDQLRKAGAFARSAFLDYDIDSKAVRLLRQSFLPFISWGYAITPVLGRIALNQPWKIANVLMAYYLIDAAMAGMADDDDEETRKSLPENIRERMFFGKFGPNMHIRIPFMGDAENPVYYKLGDYVPFASMTKGLPNGMFGQTWIPSIVSLNGPLISFIGAAVFGVDQYTGDKLSKPSDTQWQKFKNVSKELYDIAVPPVINSDNLKKATDIINEKQGPTGKTPSAAFALARSLGGLKIYQYNVEESLAFQDLKVEKITREFSTAMNEARRDENAKGSPDYDALDAKLDDLEQRLTDRIAEIRGEEKEK